MSEQEEQNTNSKLEVLSALVSRMMLAQELGAQYNGERRLYEALGYKTHPSFQDYWAHYDRQDIAAAVIDRPVDGSWSGGVTVQESEEEQDTPMEADFKAIRDQLKLEKVFQRLDKLAGLGRYGILLLGLSDCNTNADFAMPVQSSNLSLNYVKPLGEDAAQIERFDGNVQSPRFGLPETYQVTFYHPAEEQTKQVSVHADRIIHVCDGNLQSEYEGKPRLHGILNRLYDLEKVAGGSAEMFWRGARPGYQGKVDPEYHLSEQAKERFKEQLDEYEHDLRRFFVNEGVNLEALQQQIGDPSPQVQVALDLICAEKRIPKRVLLGSERGELASTQDRSEWLERLQERRSEFIQPAILEPFLQAGVQFGFIRPPQKAGAYSWIWNDLFSQDDKTKAEIGNTRSQALSAYAKQPGAQEVVPQEQFLLHFLGLGEDQVQQIQAAKGALEENEDNEPEE